MAVTLSTTILDVIESNFDAVKAKSYVLRAIFIGEHDFQQPTVINDHFKTVIQEVNSSYFDVPVKGCVIIYRKYYIAIIEGSEETVARQINLLFAKDIDGLLRGRSKLLIVYHNILRRLSVTWQSVFADQKDLVTKINHEEDLKFQYEFLQKIVYKVDQAYKNIFEKQDDNMSNVEVADTNLDIYPENNDLETILNFEFIMDLKEYAAMYETLPDYTYSFEKCWPTPFDFTPRVYDDSKIKDVFIEQLPAELDLLKENDEILIERDKNSDNKETAKLPDETEDTDINP